MRRIRAFGPGMFLTTVMCIVLSCKGQSSDARNTDSPGIQVDQNTQVASTTQTGGDGMSATKDGIRESALAGSWYPADAKELRDEITLFLQYAKVTPGLGRSVALIAPHAGYRYSGPVAAYAYKQVMGRTFDTVVVVAPNHADPRLDFSSVLTRGGYETPLGLVPVDEEAARAVVNYNSSDSIQESDLVHLTEYNGRMEHSLEIQLPFLQVVLNGPFKLLPVVMGDQKPEAVRELADALAVSLKGKNALIIASSDLSHFYEQSAAERLDDVVRQHVEAFDPAGLLTDAAAQKCQACGMGSMAAVMMAAKQLGAERSTVLNMATSGDVTGDKSSVVGYLAAVMSTSAGETQKTERTEKVGVDLGLTAQEKEVLRNVVRNTLKTVVEGKPVPAYNNFNGKLGEKWGAFVTLNKNGSLRGCIGTYGGYKPLISTVAEMTHAAALEDTRFSPVTPDELDSIGFEISVLTPIREIADINEIVVGRDGIIITRGPNRGLLLPQVATEYGWDRETFLGFTCRKAGLPENAWKQPGTKIEIFSAEVFK